MALNVIVLTVEKNSNITQFTDKIPTLSHGISCIGGELNYTEIISTCDKERIKKRLICLSDTNENNIIILFGDTTVFPILPDVAYEAIKEIIDSNPRCDDLTTTMSDLTEKLQHSFDRDSETLSNNNNLDASGDNNNSDASGDNNKSDASSDNNNPDTSSDNNNPDVSCDNPDEKSSLLSNDEMKNFLVSMKICKKQNQSAILSLTDAISNMRTMLQKSKENPLTEIVKTNDAYGRILAEDILSTVNVPSSSTSTKQGYAVLASAGKGVRRVLRADLAFAEISVKPDTCVRVRSGTPIPKGATAVVTLENTKIIEENDENDDDYFQIYDKEYEIEVLIDPKEEANIRTAGCEIRRNQYILEKHLRIGPAELGILTLCGIYSVRVNTVPSVGLLSIGDELVELGKPLTSGHIYDSNRITLISLLKKNDFDPVDFGISAYRVTDMLNKIEDALDKVDILVTMGHANDKDILKPILMNYFNAVFHFGRLDIKPGKSTAFASCKFNHKKKHFVCMSANPATVPIVAHLFLLPFLNEMHRNYFANITINLQSCVNTSYKLHTRPKFSWTNLQWMEKEQFPRAKCLRNSQHQNMIRYSKANALLMLPPCTMYQTTIDHGFLQTMFYG